MFYNKTQNKKHTNFIMQAVLMMLSSVSLISTISLSIFYSHKSYANNFTQTIKNNIISSNYYSNNNIDIAFSPNKNALKLIIDTINKAQNNICMASYSFTSKPIANALLNAKLRGVKIKIVADYKSNKNSTTIIHYLAQNGIEARLNQHYAIMHNKFMIIDNNTVETGSFNYSVAASSRNAENIIVIHNNQDIASQYLNQCLFLFNESDPI